MGIKKLINKFLKRNTKTTDISTFGSLINLPSRNQIETFEGAIDYLDKLKEEYTTILSKKRIVLSNDLNFGDLRKKIDMHIDLIINLTTEEEKALSFENATYYSNGTKRIKYITKIGKLNSYFESLKKLEVETLLRLMALKEILEEKIFLSPLKKNSIISEINNLSHTFLNLKYQKGAIKIEIDRFFTEYELLENEEFASTEIEPELIKNKCQELRSMIDVLIPNHQNTFNISENSTANIIFMEEVLERYIYNHQEEAESLKNTLNDLIRYLKDNLELEKISKTILELELKLKAFAIYSRNLISEEDIFNLYTLKFACLTRNFMKENINFADNANYIELECYQEIITKKISDILTGKNAIFNKIFKSVYKDNIIYAIKTFATIMKGNEKEFSFWNIINNRLLLGLLVSFDKLDGLKEYFDSIIEEKAKYLASVDFHEEIFKYNRNIPLSTVFDALYYSGEETFSPLYDLYKMMKEQDDNLIFRLPLGLKKVKLQMSYHDLGFFNWKFVQTIRDKCNYAHIKFPPSLVEIEGNLFENIHSQDVELNEGLKSIGDSLFEDASIETIYIPASLENIEFSTFRGASVDEFYFIDYQHSKLTPDSIENLIRKFFIASKTGKKYKNFISERAKRKQKEFADGTYTNYDDSDLNDHTCTLIEFRLIPTFSRIILCDEYSIPMITIEAEELVVYARREKKFSRSNSTLLNYNPDILIKEEEVTKIFNKIRKVIKNKTLQKDTKVKTKKKN